MEKQVFLESVIRMYGGVEPLAEELLNEIGDKVDSDMHRVLSRIVLRNHRYDKDKKKYSPEVFDEFKKIFEERHPEDEIGNMTAEDVCNMYQDELEEYIKTVPEKLI